MSSEPRCVSGNELQKTDRRCGRRLSISLPITLTAESSLQGQLIDLSLCGCGILLKQPLAPDSPVTLHLILPNEDGFTHMNVNGRVARCHPIRNIYLTGLAFHQLKPYQAYEMSVFFNYHQRFSA